MPLALAMDYDWDRRAFSLHTLRTFAQFVQPMSASLGDRRELARPLSALAAIQGHFLSAFAARPTESIRNLKYQGVAVDEFTQLGVHRKDGRGRKRPQR
jgi:hypothetical protein